MHRQRSLRVRTSSAGAGIIPGKTVEGDQVCLYLRPPETGGAGSGEPLSLVFPSFPLSLIF